MWYDPWLGRDSKHRFGGAPDDNFEEEDNYFANQLIDKFRTTTWPIVPHPATHCAPLLPDASPRHQRHLLQVQPRPNNIIFSRDRRGLLPLSRILEASIAFHLGHAYSVITEIDRLCGLVVRVPGYRFRGPGSIPGATRFPEKQWVWNGVHSASWVQLRS
jgi:hypothetical protein